MQFDIAEHKKETLIKLVEGDEDNNILYNQYLNVKPRTFLSRNNTVSYYKVYCEENCIKLQADYYIGADWILPNKKFVYVAPKVNIKLIEKFEEQINKSEEDINNGKALEYCPREINYLKMYLDAATHTEVLKHTDGLLFIDWDAPEIPLEQKQDLLTPFLVVQYLNLLKQIVRKGLKKSYYKVTDNIQSRIKGKILVGRNIKTNIVKNRLTRTVCQYQEFGVDNIENHFLKKVLLFVSNYIANNQDLFKGNENTLRQMIGYCNPAFESVSDVCNEYELKHIKTNVFFKEYKEAIKIGKLILNRFAYNISNTSQSKIITIPPFWIDMPRLFELYVYGKLLDVYPASEVNYHFKTYGNELDFLITNKDRPMVVDAKYKLHYDRGHIHSDIRQVAGYARLEKVYKALDDSFKDKIIDCLIVYPNQNIDVEFSVNDNKLNNFQHVTAYRNVHKLGVNLPPVIK